MWRRSPNLSTRARSTSRPQRSATICPGKTRRFSQGDVAERVAALKRQDGDYLLVVGSTTLVHYLMQHDLVDEIRLMIDPVLVGSGKRIFPDDGRTTMAAACEQPDIADGGAPRHVRTLEA